jgi:TIGR00370 family protein
MRWVPAGDRAAVAEWRGRETDAAAGPAACAARIEAARPAWVVDVIPAYDTVTVVYDPAAAAAQAPIDGGEPAVWRFVESSLRRILAEGDGGAAMPPRVVEIPVRYGGADGPDLEACAERAGMAPDAFIEAHASARYTVAMIGFMPGFPYLSGLPEHLAQPRLAAPRRRVPAGSVGIAGVQTGVYPFDSPGGWQIIGRTDLKLFDPRAAEPSLLRAGDIVRFVPVPDGVSASPGGGGARRLGGDSGRSGAGIGGDASGAGAGTVGGVRKEGRAWDSSSDRPGC